jgi:DNA-directed RNA polymerase subunit RPC12/RpoP
MPGMSNADNNAAQPYAAPLPVKTVCGSCGAERNIPTNATVTNCPHCGSSHLVTTSLTGVVRPI